MSRPPNIIPSTRLTLKLPEDLREKLDRHLFEPSLGRVPLGAYQRFFIPILRDALKGR